MVSFVISNVAHYSGVAGLQQDTFQMAAAVPKNGTNRVAARGFFRRIRDRSHG